MDIERLRKIIVYSEKNHKEIQFMVRQFCSYAETEYGDNLLDILQIARSSLQKKGYIIFKMPFADDEIGALCYKTDGLGYVVVNTSLPEANVNFAIAHEIYHVFFEEDEAVSKIEFTDDRCYDHEIEYAANLFAGILLMPEISFKRMYQKFKNESEENEMDIIIKLMAYYRVPFMAVLIRCMELGLISGNSVSEDLLKSDKKQIRQRLIDLWLDENILNPSGQDDYLQIETLVKKTGEKYIKNEYINEHTMEKVLQNIRRLYKEIKGK